VWRWSRCSPRATVPQSCFPGTKTLTVPFPAIGHRNLHDLAVDAAPTQLPAMPKRLFSGRIALTTALFAFGRIDLNDVPIDATPAKILAMSECFFAGWITLTFALATLLGRGLDNLPVDATPTLTRRSRGWRWSRTMNRWRTRKRKPPTGRIFRRTRRMIAWWPMPAITTATFFPPPTAAVLDPDPLTTLIMPLPASDRLRRQFESVFVAVLGDSVADDHARITDGPRDSQNFEITLGKVAERVQVIHFVFDKEESVFGIVGRSGGANDHAGGVRAITGNTVGGAGVTAKCSQISDGECWLAADTKERGGENSNNCTRDLSLYVHGSVVVAANLRLAKNAFADKHEYEKSNATEIVN
jgi:hypothetical protein